LTAGPALNGATGCSATDSGAACRSATDPRRRTTRTPWRTNLGARNANPRHDAGVAIARSWRKSVRAPAVASPLLDARSAAPANDRDAVSGADLGLGSAAYADGRSSPTRTRAECSAAPGLRSGANLRSTADLNAVADLHITAFADAGAHAWSSKARSANTRSPNTRLPCARLHTRRGAAADLARPVAAGQRHASARTAATFGLRPRGASLPPRVDLSPRGKTVSLGQLLHADHLPLSGQLNSVGDERLVGNAVSTIAWTAVSRTAITWDTIARSARTTRSAVAIARTSAAWSPIAGPTTAWPTRAASEVAIPMVIPVAVMTIELPAPVVVPVVTMTVMPMMVGEDRIISTIAAMIPPRLIPVVPPTAIAEPVRVVARVEEQRREQQRRVHGVPGAVIEPGVAEVACGPVNRRVQQAAIPKRAIPVAAYEDAAGGRVAVVVRHPHPILLSGVPVACAPCEGVVAPNPAPWHPEKVLAQKPEAQINELPSASQ
jgi:hypothetical protein